MLYNKFPRECGPPRKVANNMNEWLKFVNIYNGKKSAVYTSIYNFKQIEIKPNYDSAVIDKLFFDFDDKSCNAWNECNKLHLDLLKNDIKHIIIMSGRGYHLYILTEEITNPQNIKSLIYNSQHHFIDKLQLIVDAQVIGNPAQLARVPNTFNIRGNRFCIPLTKNQFEKGDIYCKELASKQNFVKNVSIGEKLFNIKQFDYQTNKFNENTIFELNNINESSNNIDSLKDAPPCIKNILNNKNSGWKERYLVILYYRELGYTKQEIFNILKKHLSEHKFRHCIIEERQLQYLWDRHDLTFPQCNKIINDELCPIKCNKYNSVIYK